MEEKKYIDQKEIRDQLYAAYRTAEKFGFELSEDVVLASIDNAIVADVVERKTAQWTFDDFDDDRFPYQCTNCKRWARMSYDYCPWCGAKMAYRKGENV